MSDAPWLVAVFVAMSNREGGSEMNPELSSRIYPPPLVPDGYFLILVTAGRNSSHSRTQFESQSLCAQLSAQNTTKRCLANAGNPSNRSRIRYSYERLYFEFPLCLLLSIVDPNQLQSSLRMEIEIPTGHGAKQKLRPL
mmetsp:Transcript_27037/g.79904  ORF Transcript_27037/g.79904 Transcript_27037/m.79904 type:complete len:139 (-) Transcript_27037:145-561(-)